MNKVKKSLGTFEFRSNPLLLLKNLFADVTVRPCEGSKGSVDVEGSPEVVGNIKADMIGSSELEITGKLPSGGTIVQRGSGVSISHSFSFGSSIIINGEVVSPIGKNGKLDYQELPKLTISVPVGTHVESRGVFSLDLRGLKGKLYIHSSLQEHAEISDVTKCRLDLSGQSRCVGRNVSGTLDINCGGQSDAHIEGEFTETSIHAHGQASVDVGGFFTNISVNASGQSDVDIRGSYADCDASASGMANVTVRGKGSGRVSSHQSGMAEVRIRK